jgi:hypothetical protein
MAVWLRIVGHPDHFSAVALAMGMAGSPLQVSERV